ncbi:hypothetical protein FBY35_5954 [Streptomyces sp. SLBN-118]|uniref:hypothetical protein n=1 Tax=Streptomyces sp. SLBN-118 TaxID=2768454 RepID=UPI00114E42E1|nr:hypothetical protein [Streptomyces sp. SLBN-118]TQK44450.1 hypothetical protein FBY35_5954 [Streptomyces sp. SLBN-118]
MFEYVGGLFDRAQPATFALVCSALLHYAVLATRSETAQALWQLSRRQRRLTVRAAFVLLGLCATVALIPFSLFGAGVALILTASVRLASPRKQGWTVPELDVHILTEVFFHSTALVGTALGINFIALGHYSDLQNGQRVTITLTLLIGSVVAVNKSTTRTRKLCTEITKGVSGVRRHMESLHSVRELNKNSERLPDKRQECHEKIDDLSRALDTRLNTGYRQLGTRVLPVDTFKTLMTDLHTAADEADRENLSWSQASPLLDEIRAACAKHVDEMA